MSKTLFAFWLCVAVLVTVVVFVKIGFEISDTIEAPYLVKR